MVTTVVLDISKYCPPPPVLLSAVLIPLMLQGRISATQWNAGVGEMEGECKCVVNVRLLCPRTRLSA